MLQLFPGTKILVLRNMFRRGDDEKESEAGVPLWLVILSDGLPRLQTVVAPCGLVWERGLGKSMWMQHHAQAEALRSLQPWYELPCPST